jgi:hypothetical protein
LALHHNDSGLAHARLHCSEQVNLFYFLTLAVALFWPALQLECENKVPDMLKTSKTNLQKTSDNLISKMNRAFLLDALHYSRKNESKKTAAGAGFLNMAQSEGCPQAHPCAYPFGRLWR